LIAALPQFDAGGLVTPFYRNILLSMSTCLLTLTVLCQPPSNGPAPRTRSFDGKAAQRAASKRNLIYHGDIIGDKAAPAVMNGRPRPLSVTVASPQSLWPQVGGVATVYYVNANADSTNPTDEAANANIQTAVNTFNADFSGLIQWVPWVSADGSNYVEINLNDNDFSGECEAANARRRKATRLSPLSQ